MFPISMYKTVLKKYPNSLEAWRIYCDNNLRNHDIVIVRQMVYNIQQLSCGGLFMEYISVIEAAEKWNITRRRVQLLCSQGRIEGAQKIGTVWIIPKEASKPLDKRIKSDIKNTDDGGRT